MNELTQKEKEYLDNPAREFEELHLKESLYRGIFGYGFEKPSIIQQTAIRPLIDGCDVIGQAQSGTGKTAASPAQSAAGFDKNVREKGSTLPLQATSRVQKCPRYVAPAWFCPRLWGPLSLCKRVRIGLAERYRTKCAAPANQQLLRSSSRELTEYVNRLRSAL